MKLGHQQRERLGLERQDWVRRLVKFLCCEEENRGVLKSFREKNDEVEEVDCKREGELRAEAEGWQAALSPPSLLFLSVMSFFPTVEQEAMTVSHFI